MTVMRGRTEEHAITARLTYDEDADDGGGGDDDDAAADDDVDDADDDDDAAGGGGGGGGGWRLSLHFTLRDNRNNDHPALEIFHYMDLDYIPMKSLTSG